VICHGPWSLVEAGVVRGRRITSWPTIRTDLRNAGAEVIDEEVVVDGSLVSSRSNGASNVTGAGTDPGDCDDPPRCPPRCASCATK